MLQRPPFISTHRDHIPKSALVQALDPPPGIARPLLSFKRARNLADTLVRSRLIGTVRPPVDTGVVRIGFTPSFAQHSRPCGVSLCACCPLMSGLEVMFTDTSQHYATPSGTNCDTRGVVYVLRCSRCSRRNTYVGQTGRTLKARINGHRADASLQTPKEAQPSLH